MHEIQSITFLLAEDFRVFRQTFQEMQHDMVKHIMKEQGRLMDRIHGNVYGGVILLRLHELLRVTYSVT